MAFEIAAPEAFRKIPAMVLKTRKPDYLYIRYRQAFYFQNFHSSFSPYRITAFFCP